MRERLGHEAAVGLLDLLTVTRTEWTGEMIDRITERSERRLIEETSKLGLEMARGFASLRQEMAEGFAGIRKEMADQRFELLKWAFLFWVGQFFAIATMMTVFARVVRGGV
jgi:hypothetical protein